MSRSEDPLRSVASSVPEVVAVDRHRIDAQLQVKHGVLFGNRCKRNKMRDVGRTVDLCCGRHGKRVSPLGNTYSRAWAILQKCRHFNNYYQYYFKFIAHVLSACRLVSPTAWVVYPQPGWSTHNMGDPLTPWVDYPHPGWSTHTVGGPLATWVVYLPSGWYIHSMRDPPTPWVVH